MAPPKTTMVSLLRSSTLLSFTRPHIRPTAFQNRAALPIRQPAIRSFTTTRTNLNWLMPKRNNHKLKDHKGRPRVATGGSTRGTTVLWGDYGLRMRDHDRRISSHQLRNGEEVIRRRLRGLNYRLFTRLTANTAVYTKGNESRMGTGKGSFDHWAVRVPVSRIVFEVQGDCHEAIIRDAMRLAANKMPGLYEFVKRGDAPVMGVTKLENGVTPETLRRPRKALAGETTSNRLPGTSASVPPTQTQPIGPLS